MLEAIKIDWLSLDYISDELKNDKEFMSDVAKVINNFFK